MILEILLLSLGVITGLIGTFALCSHFTTIRPSGDELFVGVGFILLSLIFCVVGVASLMGGFQ